MPSSSLPDLNTLWLKWTDVCNNCLRQSDFYGAIGALYHLNAVFGDENRVEINTEKFQQLTRENVKAVCKFCNEEISRDEMVIKTVLTDSQTKILTGKNNETIWNCVNCRSNNLLKNTSFVKEKFNSPRYLGVIPDPPIRKRGIAGQKVFEVATKNWIRHAQDEISYAFGIERREYVPKADRDDIIDNDNND